MYLGGTVIISVPSEEAVRELLATKISAEEMQKVECIGGVVQNPEMANLLYFDNGDY